ncbi:InlB B-repeat-containing protein [Candidatus Saccharibacteria bacterium]|nr:InlB B-repeat-containing protein [Candidatus Saccharibacteria bacterium]
MADQNNMKKYKLFLNAAFALIFVVLVATSNAQTTNNPTTPSQDADGYYLIGTAAELYGFAEIVNNGNAAANAKLTADITVNENVLDANGEANTGDFVQWTPIGNDYFEDKVYSGTFDGQGHTISGLYVSGNGWFVGFVGQVSGTAVVKNLGIVDSYFSSSNNNLGSIVGGVAEKSSVTIANVYSTSTVKGDNFIGGLVGGDGNGSVTIINSYFAGKTSTGWSYDTHHDDLVAGYFDRSTLTVCNTFVVGTSLYGTTVTAEQMSDGTVAAALHYYQDALADGSMFGLSGGKTNFSGTIDGVSVTTANITLHTFDGDATAYSSKYIVGNTTPLPVMVEREGYTFFGWYDNADLEGDAVTSISSSETGNKEYWAKFERSHAVSFVLGGGTIRSGEIDHYIEGETTALPTFVLKNGASFEGWYTTEDFTGSRYYSIPATATEDMTFYAKWGAEKTTFYLGQGPEPVSILYEGENMVWLDKTTMERYVIFDNFRNYWGSNPGINVPYTGGESTFGYNRSKLSVAQSGFYVFTLTDKGGESWFVSVLKSMLNCDVASIPTQVYTGSAIEPVVTVKDGETTLTLGTDYDVTYSNNVNAGTATVTITGKGNYSGETAATFTIAKSMTNEDITITIPEQTYTGSAIEPEVTVTDGETTLTLGTDYTIGYSANVNVGTATVTIAGMGNYVGVIEKKFEITKAPLTITAKNWTITYGDDPENDGVEYSGFVNGETESVLNGELSYAYNYTQFGNVGEYAITPSGLTADNYDISFASGTLTVEPKKTDFAAVQILEDENGARAIIDGEYTADNAAVNIPENIEVASVEFTRSFTPEVFATVTFPFEVNTSCLTGVDSIIEFQGITADYEVDFGVIWKKTENGEQTHITLQPYHPYMISMNSTKLGINCQDQEHTSLTLKATSEEAAEDIVQRYGNWIFTGTLAYKQWQAGDPDLTPKRVVYGYAAEADGKYGIGAFVRIGSDASISPFRAYIKYSPLPQMSNKPAPAPAGVMMANSAVSGNATASIDNLPESMDVVITSKDENGNEHTTVIGSINTRTGEIRFNRRSADRWFDMQGRVLQGKPSVKGRYLHNGKVEIVK